MMSTEQKPIMPPLAWLMLGVALIGLIALAFQSHPALHGAISSIFSGEAPKLTIGGIADNYFGQLSRPLVPEMSLFLPLGVQAAISLGIIVAMLTVGWARPQARSLIMILSIVSVSRHLLWRAVDTMDFQTQSPLVIGVGWMIFIAEMLAFVHMALGYFQIWKPTNRQAPRISTDNPERLPMVDVFVPTYNEPVSVVYRTLVGCIGMEYPNKRVHLCDDKNRPEMAQLAEKLGVVYLSRTNNLHAKAGNLNNAMRHSNGEFVLIFDADHVPSKKFLNEVVGYFQDPQVAFVQTPQHFFTLDPFQRNLLAEKIANNEQDLFYHVIQPGNDHWGAAFFAGSGAIFRRRALESVGGFAVETITEDFHTSIRVQALGWKSVYHNKDLAAGLAQDSYADFVKQRLRWAKGMTQVMFHDNPLLVKGLSLAQRLCYFAGIMYFFNGVHRLIFLIAPLFFLLFGLMTINAGFLEVTIYYLPSFVCLFFGYTVLTHGFRHTFWSEVYESATCVDLLCATFSTLLNPYHKTFNVTPKGGTTAQATFHWQSVWVQIFLTIISVFAIFMGVFRTLTTPSYTGGILTNLFWTIYNITLLVGAFFVAQERPQLRLNPRIDRRIRCDLRLLDGTIAVGYTTNVSENGVAIEFEEPVPVSGTMALKILDWEANEISFLSVQAVRSVIDEQGRHYVGFRIVNRTEEQHRKLIYHMFGSAETWKHEQTSLSPLGAYKSFLESPVRLSNTAQVTFRRRSPRFRASLQARMFTAHHDYTATTVDLSESGMSLMIYHPKENMLQSRVDIQIQWTNGQMGQLQGVVKRVDPMRGTPGAFKVAIGLVDLTKEQRQQIINQLFGPRPGIVRVAPPSHLMIRCEVRKDNGQQTTGVTQEVSEMGLRLVLDQPLQIDMHEEVTISLHWQQAPSQMDYGRAPAANQQDMVRQYRAIVVGYQHPGVGNMRPGLMLYFKDLDLASLDEIARYLHQANQMIDVMALNG